MGHGAAQLPVLSLWFQFSLKPKLSWCHHSTQNRSCHLPCHSTLVLGSITFPLLSLLLCIILAPQAHNSAAYLHDNLLDLGFNSLQRFSGHVHEPCSQENTGRNAAQEAEDPVMTT